jgi:DNA-binding transcriptional regulator YiaG
MAKKIKSEAFESIHRSASALLAIGAIDKATMREFDDSCIAEVPGTRHGDMPKKDEATKLIKKRSNIRRTPII